MKTQKVATKPDTDTVVEAEVIDEDQPETRREFLAARPLPGDTPSIIDTETLLLRVPVSPGTLRNWREAGKLPYIKTPGRRILWHWPTVEQALIRMQRSAQ